MEEKALKNPKLEIQLLHDEKNRIGKTVYPHGNHPVFLYSFGRDALIGDITFDHFYEYYPDKTEELQLKFNNMRSDMESDEIYLVQNNSEGAERVASYCRNFFSGMGVSNIEIEVQYFNKLEDVEYQILENCVGRY